MNKLWKCLIEKCYPLFQNAEDQDIQNNFTSCYVWISNVVSYSEGKTLIRPTRASKQNAQENI
jgi:hypothetical protein